ncbi:MAG: hypothetical protein RDU20_14600 [Desulfomonilaceae bacterium]|nr:hypothetical protein [Desulfomonilaceae bacterium]
MGLVFSHGDLCSSSYGGFYRFKKVLAQEAGIDLLKMAKYGGNQSWDEINDPLKPFFENRDEYDGGGLTPMECLTVKRRIQELADCWCDEKGFEPHCWKQFAMRLATGMAEAAFLGDHFYWC